MADIKISQLGAAIAVGDTDLVPIVSGGNTLKATAAQVKEHSIGNTNISSIGDGSVTGAISALNTDKQPKTLDTPLTIGGVSKTTVEAALDGLNSESQSLSTALTTKAPKPLVITLPNVSSSKLSFTSTDVASIANVNTNHVVIESVLSNPSIQTGDWTITTGSNSIVVSGSIASSGTTNLTLTLIEKA